MPELRTLTGREIDEIPLSEYLGGTAAAAAFKTTFSGQPAVIKLFAGSGARLANLEAAAKLSHPHLLRIFKAGRGDIDGTESVYVVTEFADENLAQVLPERALTPEETREVLRSSIEALSYLHSLGFVHADLKPANIMAIGDQLKLSIDSVQRSGEPLVRPADAHDAPEAPQKVTPAADMWSLGMTLVEVLTQQLPPKPTSENAGPAVPESIPAPYREIAQHSLLRTPELRWTTADIMAKLNPKAATPVPVSAAARMETPRAMPPRPASKRPLILVGIVAVVVAAIVLIPRMSDQSSRPPVATQSASQSNSPQPAPEPPTESAKTESTTRISAPAPAEVSPSERHTESAPAAAPVEKASAVKHITDEPSEDTSEGDTESDSAPGIVHKVMPSVIPQARNSIHGKVRVTLTVNVDQSGNVVESSFISRGPSRYFAKVAEEAARQWKFTPASADARAWNLEFDFRRSGTTVRSTEER